MVFAAGLKRSHNRLILVTNYGMLVQRVGCPQGAQHQVASDSIPPANRADSQHKVV